MKLKEFHKISEGNSSAAIRNIVKMNNIGKPKSEQSDFLAFKADDGYQYTEAEYKKKVGLETILAKKSKCSDLFQLIKIDGEYIYVQMPVRKLVSTRLMRSKIEK